MKNTIGQTTKLQESFYGPENSSKLYSLAKKCYLFQSKTLPAFGLISIWHISWRFRKYWCSCLGQRPQRRRLCSRWWNTFGKSSHQRLEDFNYRKHNARVILCKVYSNRSMLINICAYNGWLVLNYNDKTFVSPLCISYKSNCLKIS